MTENDEVLNILRRIEKITAMIAKAQPVSL